MVSTFDLPFPGAWPLDRADGYYTRFGMPRLPIWLQFQPEFTPEMGSTFENWLGDVGGANGIPELVKTCLRSFLVQVKLSFSLSRLTRLTESPQDLAASQESIWRTWDHFLRDKRPANPSLVLREYYGDKADPLNSLITTGYLRAWWLGVRKDIQAQRDRGLSAVDAAQSLRRYLLSSTFHHTSSIHSGAFRSPRIVQALAIVEKSEFRKTCVSDDPSSIRSSVRRLTDTLSNARGFDPYVRCNEAFWRCFEDLNCDFLMNSSNLEFMIEMMLSQLLWMLGPNNETVVAYFQVRFYASVSFCTPNLSPARRASSRSPATDTSTSRPKTAHFPTAASPTVRAPTGPPGASPSSSRSSSTCSAFSIESRTCRPRLTAWDGLLPPSRS